MKCSKQVQEQLPSLAANELSRLQAWRLKRHCRTCPACRTQWEQAQQLWAGLKNMETVPIADKMRASVFAQLPPLTLSQTEAQTRTASSDPHRNTAAPLDTREIMMRKRLIAATGAVLIIAVTGTFAAQLLTHKMGAGIGDRAGHIWHISSSYRGEVRLYDPENQLIGTTRNSQPGSSLEGTVELDVAGAHMVLHDAERREVRDSNHILLGYAELVPTSMKRFQEELAHGPKTLLEALLKSEEEETKFGGVSGVSSSPLGANGWDKQIGVSWKVRGHVAVTAYNAAGKMVGQANGGVLTESLRKQLPAAMLPPATPRIELTVNGKKSVEQGYGTHEIKNEAGKLLLRLEIKPPADKRADRPDGLHDSKPGNADTTTH